MSGECRKALGKVRYFLTSSVQLDWKAATWAGIFAGLVLLMLEMVMIPLFGGGSPWGPPRMMAAIVLGEGVLPPPATFDEGIIMAAMGLHFVLSIVYAVVFALVVSRLSLGPALALGGVGGLILYLVIFYGFTALFPWFAMAGTGSASSAISGSGWLRPGHMWGSGNIITMRRRPQGHPCGRKKPEARTWIYRSG